MEQRLNPLETWSPYPDSVKTEVKAWWRSAEREEQILQGLGH